MQHDLTQGSITGRLVGMAAFIGMGLLFQTLYFLVDLYFVGRHRGLGHRGRRPGGQRLLPVHGGGPDGRRRRPVPDRPRHRGEDRGSGRRRLSAEYDPVPGPDGVITLVVGYGLAHAGLHLLAADEETASMGVAYLYGFLPALA
jgi:hypothetical protein